MRHRAPNESMNAGTTRSSLVGTAVCLLTVIIELFTPPPAMAGGLPPTMVWVWETPTDLAHVSRSDVGVAFLGATVEGRRSGVTVRMRRATLILPRNRPELLPVLRIHSFDRHFAPGDERARANVLQAASKLLRDYGVNRLQIDFDATASERAFYAAVLDDLRREVCIPGRCFLSMTALGSWCLPGDFWLEALPVDEIVPMLFSLGPMTDRRAFARELESRPLRCGSAIGLWSDDLGRPIGSRRLYVFTKGAWSADTVEQLPRPEP